MGHGISSALITMSLQSLFHRLITKGIPADVVMKELDNYLHHLFNNIDDTWHYCTVIYLFIDTEKKAIDYINAGHPSPIYQVPSGEQQELKSTTPPIGTFEGINFKTTQLSYTKGAKLLLFTDGVSEPLEPDRLCTLLMENSSSSLDEIKEQILLTLEKQGDEYRTMDDRCFILIELK